jgi:hypothetical protein
MSTTTTTHAEAVDAHGKPLTAELRSQAVPVLDAQGKPTLDAQGRPVFAPKPKLTDEERAHNRHLLLAMIATDWVRGDKHHLVEIEALALALTDELGEAAAEAKLRLAERPAARAAGPNVLAQKKAQAIVRAEAAVDAAKHGNAAAKEAAAAELRRAHALPDAV